MGLNITCRDTQSQVQSEHNDIHVRDNIMDRGFPLKCNIERSFFGQTEMEYLDFWVTRDDVRPINRNIEAIKNMVPPTSRK